ncbi:MAG: AraC family transcriptional regulator [Clostridia bacterium]|nr:AraC family transcriptional regulator [Clostridia bacterium]
MKEYDVEHLFENGNIDGKTECLCQKVSSENRSVRIHDHEFYEIFLTLSEVGHFINGKNEKLGRGTLVFIKPSDIHGILYNENRRCEIVNLSFSSRLMRKIIDYLVISQAFIDNLKSNKVMLDEYETQRLSEKLNMIVNGERTDLLYKRCVLFELVTMFLQGESDEKKMFPQWFEKMCEQMKSKENFTIGIERMLEISGKSREYISRSIKKYLGISATEFVNNLRLAYSASQLINTDKNVTDICMDVGFYSISWFNKIFAKKYGMSPKEFRKKGESRESRYI